MKKYNSIFIFGLVLFTITLIVVDYNNIPSMLNININKINYNFWSVITVWILYAITYFAIDKLENKRKRNQVLAVKSLLKDCYNKCNDYTKLMFSEYIIKLIPEKFPGDITLPENKIYNNIKNAPFENENLIMNFISQGVITVEQFDTYIKIKSAYSKMLTNAIIFPDISSISQPPKNELQDLVHDALKKLI